jgi:fructosamine-3-kinase
VIEAVAFEPIAGGSLNAAYRATLEDGTVVFVKTSPDAAPGAYAAEAAGLAWLGAAGGLPVPRVHSYADDFLALEWIGAGGRPDPAALGRGLAQVHAAGAARFGELPGDGKSYVLGPLTLPNTPRDDWPAFYAESRLLPLAEMAAQRGALDAAGVAAVEAVASKTEDLAGPAEPPARLHGDLWSGNVLGRHLIDPAAYGGHREIDLAMLSLFGSPPRELYDNYDAVAPRAQGHQERVALYQLLPLLVHAVLFGGGYGAAAARAARRYL